MSVKIEIAGGKTGFRPGEVLEGEVVLTGPAVPADVEVLLHWRTEGKGTRDTKIAERLKLGHCTGERTPFKLKLPDAPYSFSGKLVSLVWSIQAATNRSARSDDIRLTISPSGGELLLHRK